MSGLPFIPGLLTGLFIAIIVTKIYMIIANSIGEVIRMFFVSLWKKIKK